MRKLRGENISAEMSSRNMANPSIMWDISIFPTSSPLYFIIQFTAYVFKSQDPVFAGHACVEGDGAIMASASTPQALVLQKMVVDDATALQVLHELSRLTLCVPTCMASPSYSRFAKLSGPAYRACRGRACEACLRASYLPGDEPRVSFPVL